MKAWVNPGDMVVIPPSQRARRPLGRWAAQSPVLVATLVLLVYGLWLGRALPHSHRGWSFLAVSRGAIYKSAASHVITAQRKDGYYPLRYGYDGQWYFFIALDPLHARAYLDNPPYRYARIVYPLLARLLAGARPALIPFTMIAINLAALWGGTLAVACWLRRRHVAPWFALVYGFYPGLLFSLKYDLADALALALVALAMYLLDISGTRTWWAACSFACAVLTKETTALYPLLYAACSLLSNLKRAPGNAGTAPRRRFAPLIPLAVALLPALFYQLFLWYWIRGTGDQGNLPEIIPFHGLLVFYPWQANVVEGIRSVVFPALICAAMGLWALPRARWSVEVWTLLGNVLLFVVLLPPASYGSIYDLSRVSASVMLSALYCLPIFDSLTGKQRWWLWTSMALWLALSPFLLLFPNWHR